jgi:dTDP-4-amino-4,6-dideoxygalactose transaminase
MSKIPLVDLKAQYEAIAPEINEAMIAVLENTAFIQGSFAAEFERSFADYTGAAHCIGMGNGTDAIYVALRAAGIGEGDEVITAVNTFIATSEAITMTGATIRFVDVDPGTYNLDPDRLAEAITPKTKAVVPIHLYGHSADMDPIMEIAGQHNLFVLEDSAQAHGAEYKGKRVGTIGDAATFSFYPGKNLGAYGDAGAVVTNNKVLADKVRMLANHGRQSKYLHEMEGVNSRMDGLQGAVLSVKLRHLSDWTEARRNNAAYYGKNLAVMGEVVKRPRPASWANPVWHLYVIEVDRRDALKRWLNDRGIGAGIHYPVPLHMQPAYAHLNIPPGTFPVSETAADRILSLPMYPELTEEQMGEIIHHIAAFFD